MKKVNGTKVDLARAAVVPALILLDGIRAPNGELLRTLYRDQCRWRLAHLEIRVGMPVEVSSPIMTLGGPNTRTEVRVTQHPVPVWEIFLHVSPTEAVHYSVPADRAYERTPVKLVQVGVHEGTPQMQWRDHAAAAEIEARQVRA